MIKEANFLNIFSDSSQMMLTLGRNMQKFEKKLMATSLIRKYDVIIVILMSRQQKVESLHCFFVFGWIGLKFGVRGNFRILISNLNSKMQYSSKS